MSESDRDKPIRKWWHVTVLILWLIFGIAILVLAKEAGGRKIDPLPEVSLLLIVIALVFFWGVARRAYAIFRGDITRGEAKEHDLWHGERLFLVGLAGLIVAAGVSEFCLGLPVVDARGLLEVLGALLVIAPVSVWMGEKRGILRRLRAERRAAGQRRDAEGSGGIPGAGSEVEAGAGQAEVAAQTPGAVVVPAAAVQPRPAEKPWAAEGESREPGSPWAEVALVGVVLGALWVQEQRARRWF